MSAAAERAAVAPAMEFIDLRGQQERIRPALQARMAAVLEHGRYILGPEVAELEAALADYCGVKHCIGVANGTDALQLALLALGIGPGDEVITPSFSYVAAAEMIEIVGARTVFVDIDPRTYNIDPAVIAAAITPRTKAIVAVDLYGQCPDYDAIHALADAHGVTVIEDAAQSFGATFKGRRAGSLAKIATTSFFPSKPLGCYGDGGACFTDDDSIARALRQLRAHGQGRRYHHLRVGTNSRLDTIQAAILLAKFAVFDDELARRQAVAARYSARLGAAVPADRITLPYLAPECTSPYAQYTIAVAERDAVAARLGEAGIPTAIHYPIPLARQPMFADRAYPDFPHSDRAAQTVLSLPMHPYLSEVEQDRVVDALAQILGS